MTIQELKQAVNDLYKKQTLIPKPEGDFVKIVNIGTTQIDDAVLDAFQYEITGKRTYRKYIPFSSLLECCNQLETKGSFNRDWYKKQFPSEYAGRPCNVTTIGGILILLGLAEYKNQEYVKITGMICQN